MADSHIPRIVIAGTHSGVGKTTVALGIMAALRRRGLKVQPFKVGPDYLDPTYHDLVTGRRSRNLDGWMTSPGFVCKSFVHACEGADVAVIEGVMGLFDGLDAESEEASTAQVAKLLGAPVALVIDARAMARSAGAIALGYSTFDSELSVDALLFNRVDSESHYDFVRTAAQRACQPKLMARLPRTENVELPSRHLGLVSADRDVLPEEVVGRLVETIEDHVDLDALLELARECPAVTADEWASAPERRAGIAVATDDAFHFYYADNLDLLRSAGAEIVEFSPIRDAELPSSVDGVYFGGGYPEVHARALSQNRSMLESVRRFGRDGGAIYGECGGLMYLCERLIDTDGQEFEMVGLVPMATRMLPRLRRLGYVQIETVEPSVFGRVGTALRGHEYHYSELLGGLADDPGSHSVYRVIEPRTGRSHGEGYAVGNALASYVHLHFGSNEAAAAAFVGFCGGSA